MWVLGVAMMAVMLVGGMHGDWLFGNKHDGKKKEAPPQEQVTQKDQMSGRVDTIPANAPAAKDMNPQQHAMQMDHMSGQGDKDKAPADAEGKDTNTHMMQMDHKMMQMDHNMMKMDHMPGQVDKAPAKDDGEKAGEDDHNH